MNDDQAGALRQLAEENASLQKDVLPPRREFHSRRKKSEREEECTKEELQERNTFPLIKLIAAAFLLLIAAMFTYDLWSDKLFGPVMREENGKPVQVEIEK
ncbi:hypothetical protein ACFQPF_05935 [Fictibacillus iocasae]|uniref:Uncharacterized protein n=1 Tax=Fictibacillus iocasae TaxID=2715437 RepID=A0ABW2NNK3_9BACL